MSKILVVDDEQSICWGFEKLCRGRGHEVQTAASAEQGLQLAKESPPDLLVLDVRLPGIDGLTAMPQFREYIGTAPIIIMTAFGDMQTAIGAVRNGAFEYLLKPFDLKDARVAIERALRPVQPATATVNTAASHDMIGDSPVMQSLYKQIALAAASNANILLRGESGTGKELAARAIHRYSARSDSPFVAVNVAALSPSLAESELFGHVDGAFTGANRSREGLLSRANGGTLFLDEVADIPLPVQVKLLRVLEEKEVLPVGSDTLLPTNFRVIAATHQDLQALVRSGRFRQDLYFRLCTFEIVIPALRERPEDIPLLACHFANQIGANPISFADETLDELKRRAWYGNVRELRNAIDHALVVARSGVLLSEHLPAEQPRLDPSNASATDLDGLTEASRRRINELLKDPKAAGAIYNQMLDEIEGPMLEQIMKHFDNECAPAARALGLHRTTLKKKLEHHDFCD